MFKKGQREINMKATISAWEYDPNADQIKLTIQTYADFSIKQAKELLGRVPSGKGKQTMLGVLKEAGQKKTLPETRKGKPPAKELPTGKRLEGRERKKAIEKAMVEKVLPEEHKGKGYRAGTSAFLKDIKKGYVPTEVPPGAARKAAKEKAEAEFKRLKPAFKRAAVQAGIKKPDVETTWTHLLKGILASPDPEQFLTSLTIPFLAIP